MVVHLDISVGIVAYSHPILPENGSDGIAKDALTYVCLSSSLALLQVFREPSNCKGWS